MERFIVDRFYLRQAMTRAKQITEKKSGGNVCVSLTLSKLVVQKALDIYQERRSFLEGEVMRLAMNAFGVEKEDGERELYKRVINCYFNIWKRFKRKGSRSGSISKEPAYDVEVDERSGQIAWQL